MWQSRNHDGGDSDESLGRSKEGLGVPLIAVSIQVILMQHFCLSLGKTIGGGRPHMATRSSVTGQPQSRQDLPDPIITVFRSEVDESGEALETCDARSQPARRPLHCDTVIALVVLLDRC